MKPAAQVTVETPKAPEPAKHHHHHHHHHHDSKPPTTNSILVGQFQWLPQRSSHLMFSDEYNHKSPLTLKFKEKGPNSALGYKVKLGYKDNTGFSMSDETKYDTKIRGYNLQLRLKEAQMKAHLDLGHHHVGHYYLNPSVCLKSLRNLTRYKSVLGLHLHCDHGVAALRAAINQDHQVILTERTNLSYKGLSLANSLYYVPSTQNLAARVQLGYKHDKIETYIDAVRSKSKDPISTLKAHIMWSLIYSHSKDLQLGVQARSNPNGKAPTKRVLLGVWSKINDDITAKAKVDQNLKVTAAGTMKVNKNLTTTVYLQGRTLKRDKAPLALCAKAHLPINLGLQLDWAN